MRERTNGAQHQRPKISAPNRAVKRTPTQAMPSASSWPVLVPCAPAVLRRRLPWALGTTRMSSVEKWELHLALYRKADLLYRAGELKQAKAMFFKALSFAQGEVDTLWAIGSCFSELGHPHHAERYFRLAMSKVDWNRRGELLYNIANALFDQGRQRAALTLYLKVPHRSAAFPLAKKNIHLLRRRLSSQTQK